METLLDAEALRLLLNDAVARWHDAPQSHDDPHPMVRLALENQGYNFDLWHEEDKARDKGARAEDIATVKRNIDKLNQQRNDAMERLDEYVLEELARREVEPAPEAPLHSESVGGRMEAGCPALVRLRDPHPPLRAETGRDAGHYCEY